MQFCAPVTNLTTRATLAPALIYTGSTDNGRSAIIGVACSGMYITDISTGLATSLGAGVQEVYVREGSSNKLVASAAGGESGTQDAYYNSNTQVGGGCVPTYRLTD